MSEWTSTPIHTVAMVLSLTLREDFAINDGQIADNYFLCDRSVFYL